LVKQPSATYRQVMQSLSDVRQYAADTKLEVIGSRLRVVGTEHADFLSAKPDEEWLYATGIRRVDSRPPPVCFVEIFFHPLFRSVQGLENCTQAPVYSLLEQQFGEEILKVQHELKAEPLSSTMASILDAKVGAPALTVLARYFNRRGTLVQASISTHPGDRFTYLGTFMRESSKPA
jgi:GntR family transcriptional regulator